MSYSNIDLENIQFSIETEKEVFIKHNPTSSELERMIALGLKVESVIDKSGTFNRSDLYELAGVLQHMKDRASIASLSKENRETAKVHIEVFEELLQKTIRLYKADNSTFAN